MPVTAVCVYCGSSLGSAPIYRETAEALGAALAGAGIRLVYGGGRIGLMGILADAVMAAGGEVTGVIPSFLQRRERGNLNVTELIETDSMHARKQAMFEQSDGFVSLPGGLGTLDETFEVVTWRQLGLHDKPIVVLDVGGYWRPFEALVDNVIAEGFANHDARDLFTVVRSVDDVVPALRAGPAQRERGRADRL